MTSAASATADSDDLDEADLVARLKTGQDAAFEQLVRQHSPRMLVVARRITRHEEDARDAVQDGLLSAFRSIAGFDGRSRLATWLHRIAINCALMRVRKRLRIERSIDEFLPTFLADGHQTTPCVEWRDAAGALLAQRETQALVRAAIDELPNDYRVVLLLRDIEGLDTAETADLLGTTAGVVKTRLHRARQALRQILDNHFRRGTL